MTTTQAAFSSTPSRMKATHPCSRSSIERVEVHPEEPDHEGDRQEHGGDGSELAAGGVLTVAGQRCVQPQQAEAPVADGGQVGDDQPQLVQHVVGVEQALGGGAGQRHDDGRPSRRVATGRERPPQPVGPPPDVGDLHQVGVQRLADHLLLDHGEPLLQPVDVRAVRVVQGGHRVVEDAKGISGAEQLAEGAGAVELVEGLAGLLAEGDEEPGRDVGVHLHGVTRRQVDPEPDHHRHVAVDDELAPLVEPLRVLHGQVVQAQPVGHVVDDLVGRSLDVEPEGGAGGHQAADLAGIRVLGGDITVLEPGPHDRREPRPILRANHPPRAMAVGAGSSYVAPRLRCADPRPTSDGRAPMAAGHARKGLLAVAAAALLLLTTACGSTSDADEAKEQALAEQLVDAAHSAGVAPRLTVDVAESFYGTKAPAVCDAFDGGLSTAEKNLILGNPAHGRRKTITDDAVTYGRVVVETYCPDKLDHYNDAVDDLDPFEVTDR